MVVVNDDLLKVLQVEYNIGALVVAVVCRADGNRVDLFYSAVLSEVKHLAEYACAGLLVFGKDLASEEGVAEG